MSETTPDLLQVQESQSQFENEHFSLRLPAPVDKSISTAIVPLKEDDFERIFFSIEDKKNDISIFEIEAQRNKALCDASEICEVMANNIDVIIDGTEGIKYETNMQGRSVSDLEGETFGFYYAFQHGEQYYRFWTSTTDLGDPASAEKLLDDALATLTFKEG